MEGLLSTGPTPSSLTSCSILSCLILLFQEYLFENGRIDNIFTDTYYDPFTSALHEVVKDFKLPVSELFLVVVSWK